MRKTVVTFAAVAFAVLAVVACQKDSPTSPEPDPTPTPVPWATLAATPAPPATPADVKPPDAVEGSLVSIDGQGNVTLYAPRVWSACVYSYTDFKRQTLSHGFTVREGFNAFDPGQLCGTVTVQVDVQAGSVASCPADPFIGPFQGFKKGHAGIVVNAAPCPKPTPTPSPTPTPTPTPSPTPTPCVEKETVKVDVVTGPWGECKAASADIGQSTVTPECRKARTVTTTTTTTYADCQNKKPKVEVVTKTEYEACPCPCTNRGYFAVTSLSDSSTIYKILDDGAVWKSNLSLNKGTNLSYRYEHAIDSSNLCLWWKDERIGCAPATCPAVGSRWHGSVSFVCECK